MSGARLPTPYATLFYEGKGNLTGSNSINDMSEIDLAQPAIVFWLEYRGTGPGAITRFDHLADAIGSVMEQPSARTVAVAWIKTMDHHLEMEQIRAIAISAIFPRLSLKERLSQAAKSRDNTKPLELVPAE
jgi:hypothetical protein